MQAVPDISAILGPIPWVLVEGLALRAYMPERMTLDVDILIHERDGTQARRAFVRAGYEITGELSIGGFSAQGGNATDAPIDVLSRQDAWLDSALQSPSLDPAGYPVLARSYLILLKLQAGRTQDLADIQRLLAGTPISERVSIRQLVIQESSELVEDFDSLCTLADLEFGSPPATD